jgi:ornithine cyclodeaminase/alanine dehydrogenase-like protein (mu-crystallin family)
MQDQFMVLFADADTVHAHLPYPELVAALRRAHQDPSPEFAAVVAADPTGAPNSFLALTAWQPNDMIAAKLVSVFPGNRARPSVQGVVVLFDGADGSVRLVADGAAMTFRKTAADSALGAALLSREDARVLLVVGAGGLAPHMIAAHLGVRPSLRTVLVWNRTPARAAALAAADTLPGVHVEAVSDLDSSVARADIVSCVTMSTEPLVRGELLRPGTHLDLVGSFTPAMREADDEAMRRSAVFVDTRNGLERSGEIQHALSTGALSPADIRGDLFELCAGQVPGRTGPEEITLYKNLGGAHLDLYTARHLLGALC